MTRSEFYARLLITTCVVWGTFFCVRALGELIEYRDAEKRCAAIAERTASQTMFENRTCWVNINSDLPQLAPNWQPEEWLH